MARLSSTISRDKVIEAFKEIDLYRAKYRHADLTPYTWCFHGDKTQGWTGQAVNHRLAVQDSTFRIGSIDASNYKYVSFDIQAMGYWIAHTETVVGTTVIQRPVTTTTIIERQAEPPRYYTSGSNCSGEYNYIPPERDVYSPTVVYAEQTSSYAIPYEVPITKIISSQQTIPSQYGLSIELSYVKITEVEGNKVVNTYKKNLGELPKAKEKFYFVDMSDEANWSGTISRIEIRILPTINGSPLEGNRISSTVTVSPMAQLEYFKVDNVDVMAEAYNQITISSADINTLRATLDQLAKTPIDWEKPGATDNRVAQFLTTVKKSDIDEVLTKVKSIAPYNGCATCDTYTCGCYQVHYGAVTCGTCDGCYQYAPCKTGCDIACYSEAYPCSCNAKCYQEATACTCNQRCYGYSSCTCDGECYSYSCRCDESCNGCDSYTPCSCDSHDPCTCNASRVNTDCSYCDWNSDSGCRSDSGKGCSCNAACYKDGGYPGGSWNCTSCDVQCSIPN